MDDVTSGISTAPRTTSRKASGPAPSVPSRTDEAAGPARPVTRPSTADRLRQVKLTDDEWQTLLAPIESNAAAGSEPVAGAAKVSPSSGPSSLSSSRQPGRWKTPRDVMELAAQANVLATQLLNGEASIPVVRAYASVTRSIASLMKAEIERRRWIDGPELALPNEEVYE